MKDPEVEAVTSLLRESGEVGRVVEEGRGGLVQLDTGTALDEAADGVPGLFGRHGGSGRETVVELAEPAESDPVRGLEVRRVRGGQEPSEQSMGGQERRLRGLLRSLLVITEMELRYPLGPPPRCCAQFLAEGDEEGQAIEGRLIAPER